MHQSRSASRNGYTSIVSPVTIHNSIGNEEKVVCKKAAMTGLFTEADLELAYKRETLAYQRALPALGASLLAAKFFASSSDLIILQDLVDEGFSSPDRMKGLSPGQMDLALEALASLHAASLTMRATDLQKWKSIIFELGDVRPSLSNFNSWLELSLQTAVTELRDLGEKDVAEILASSSPTANMEISNHAFEVICHGDYWTNNLMFRNERSIRMIDFQNLSHGPVYKDLLTLLSTSSQFDTDIVSCYRYYFQQLKKEAGSLTNFPSYEEFIAHLREGFGYGLRMGLLYLGVKLMPKDGTTINSNFRSNQLPGYRKHLLRLIDIYRVQGLFQSKTEI